MRAWRGPHKVVHVLQDGRVYVLDTGQKVHFERLKPHQGSALGFAAIPTDGGDIAILMDPEPELSADVISDDISQVSYKTEPRLSEASDVSLPSRKRHWMDTRLRATLRAGGSRPFYQQFASSTGGTDDELSDVMLPSPPLPLTADRMEPGAPSSPLNSPGEDPLPPLFSDHERVRSASPQLTASDKESSLIGTSAPLLTNPSLTDYLSNYSIWPTGSPKPDEPTPVADEREATLPPSPERLPTTSGAGTAPFKRRRGRPPKARKQPARTVRAKKKPATAELTEPGALTASGVTPRYRLRSRRQPRYKCGTCGLRDSICVLAVEENREVPIEARGVPPEGRNQETLVYRLSGRADKTFSAIERTEEQSVESILQKLAVPWVAKAPCPRFKEWTSDGKGLDFTLATVLPPVPANIVFGPFNFEREPVQMPRCITADLLHDKYGVQIEPGGVYNPAPHWWLLVSAPHVEALVDPACLLSCLESLRTSTTTELILCFHIIDWYRGKIKFAWWLELIIACFSNYPRIRLLDEWTYTFEDPLSPKAALKTLDVWTTANTDNQALPRSVWHDLAAVQGRTPRVCLPPDGSPGRDCVPWCTAT